MLSISTIGLDIAKSVFQVHGVDASGQVVLRRQLRRRHILAFSKNCRIHDAGMLAELACTPTRRRRRGFLEVRRVARDLLEKLQEQLAIADWRSKQQTRAAVQTTIRFTLNELPEEPYPEPVWNEKVDAVWAFIFARRQGQASRWQER